MNVDHCFSIVRSIFIPIQRLKCDVLKETIPWKNRILFYYPTAIQSLAFSRTCKTKPGEKHVEGFLIFLANPNEI